MLINRRIFFFLISTLLLTICLPRTYSQADTIYQKDKTILKGVVVEEHADRYILSTADGEIAIFKTVVESVSFDDPEQSYYQLGRELQRAGRLQEALEAYRKASQYQPDFQAAREAIFQVERLLWQQDESEVIDEIRQKRLVMEQAGFLQSNGMADHGQGFTQESYEKRFGFSIGYEKGWTVVLKVLPKSPAWAGGLQKRDIIIAVWGELIRNLSSERTVGLLNTGDHELSLLIERVIILSSSVEKTGLKLRPLEIELGYDGLRVTSVGEGKQEPEGSLVKGDLVVAIDGRPTRYMPLPKAYQLIDSKQSDPLQITIQRLLVLRKGSSGLSTGS